MCIIDYERDYSSYCPFNDKETPDGIFLTHAHIGHYIGLMYLGKEAMNADQVPVYAMTRMKGFLIQNGPWSQLLKINNIRINTSMIRKLPPCQQILRSHPFWFLIEMNIQRL